ncbi:MAG: AAA family ATPase [Streptosporangiaceae bacterium]|nr:AAA family ATPase [Streptosporangiaceae bacterium]
MTLPAGRIFADIERDLKRGAWLVRERGGRHEAFRLGGAEFEFRVTRRPGKDALARGETVWMAVFDRVDEARSVPPKAHRLRPATVRLAEIFEEAWCDLAEIEARVIEREQRLHGSRSRFGADDRGSHGELHRAVRKQYGELATLIELLEERPVTAEVAAKGVIVAPERSYRIPTIVVDTSPQFSESFRRQRVKLMRAAGKSFHTQVTGARRTRLEIAEPRNWHAQPGAEVEVSVVPPFGMRQNAEALKNFWTGNVEGSWDDLARLLCRPKALTLPPDGLTELTFFYSDHDPDPRVPRLNDEQRKAVTGAVASPHAYLIQGPPGTGKTEVISEIIRQLTGRGERVLLLAPSHVAVDEALHRVGRKPGVRPLRITFSDDKVREGLRVFLPENVGIETASRVLRPVDSGQEARWADERRSIEQALRAAEHLASADQRRANAVTELRAAASSASESTERLRVRRASAEQEISALASDAAKAGELLDGAQATLTLAVQVEQKLRSQREVRLSAVRDTATELVRQGEIAIEAGRAERQAVTRHDQSLAALQARLAAAGRARSGAESAAREARDVTNRAWTQFSAAKNQLDAAGPPDTMLGRFAARLGVGTLAELRRSVTVAEEQFMRARDVLSAREADWRQAVVSHDQLTSSASAEKSLLQTEVRRRTEMREIAERDFGSVWRAFTAAVAALGADLPSPGPGTAVWQWVGLARTVHVQIAAVLPPRSGNAEVTPPARWDVPGTWEEAWAETILRQVTELADALAARQRSAAAQDRARRDHEDKTRQLHEAQIWAAAEIERLTNESQAAQAAVGRCRAALDAAIADRDRLAATLPAIANEDPASLERRERVLGQLPVLAARWRQLTAERTDAQLADDIQQSLVRATNLVCATTKGIVGRGSQVVRHADYDTLIVDEASRVTESEFLIGAIRARRWVLVGDQHQLPPHVDTEDEHFLHALTALHRVASGRSPSLEQAVKELSELWKEDEELRKFRDAPVQELAEQLESSGAWQRTFQERFADAHKRFSAGKDGDTDRALLGAMVRYLVQSLFQQAVAAAPDSLRQPLVWQRRMIAPLAQVVNVPIYGGLYKSPSAGELAAAGVTPLVTSHTFTVPGVFVDTSHYRDAEETQDNHGFYNKREIELVIRICEIYNAELAERRGASPVTTSVLTFYSAQARRLERKLLPRDDLRMLDWQVIDVIDRIQGQQSDLVIISFTRAKERFGRQYGQWLMDTRRLNVACTRARRALVLVGHGDTLRRLGGGSDDRQAKRARQFYENLFGLVEADEHFIRKVKL